MIFFSSFPTLRLSDSKPATQLRFDLNLKGKRGEILRMEGSHQGYKNPLHFANFTHRRKLELLFMGCRLWGRTESDTTEVTQRQQLIQD